MNDYYYSTNLEKKINNAPNEYISDYICFWSDLLGFGKQFYECNWNLDINGFKKVKDRLSNAHNIFLGGINIFTKSLILNDGVCTLIEYDRKIEEFVKLGIFFRTCIETHIRINNTEKKYKYPGTRSVIAYGRGMKYITNEVTVDDLVFNYTKKIKMK